MIDPNLIIALVFKFLLGAAVGSFLNVAALRYGDKGWNVKGRSHCPYCGKISLFFNEVTKKLECLNLECKSRKA